MKPEDVVAFTNKNGIYLSEAEVDFVYRFIKKNYEALYANPNVDLSKYKCHFSEENYEKLMKLINGYRVRYLGKLN